MFDPTVWWCDPFVGMALHVPDTISNGYKPEGVDELRESIRDLVSSLAQHSTARATDRRRISDNDTPQPDGAGVNRIGFLDQSLVDALR